MSENLGPILREPPLVHAAHEWDEQSRRLRYIYNGRAVMSMVVPGGQEVGFRHTSDGDLQGLPFVQQLYFMVDRPLRVEAAFHFSDDAINMRPRRAGREQAIRAQLGRPLTFGVAGLYDILQDLLLEWHGRAWEWIGERLEPHPDGGLVARLSVELGPKPWFVNFKPHYYRTHLGYGYHKPWSWRPNPKPVSGWCSWEAYRRDVTERNVQEAAEFFTASLRPYGMEYIQLDDGFEKMPMPFHAADIPKSWLETNAQFPGGHAGVVQKVRQAGMAPGVWTSCGLVNEEVAQAQPDILVKDDAGLPFKGDWIGYILNCLPATLAKHVLPIYRGFRDAGYTYVKVDTIRHLLYDGLEKAANLGLLSNADVQKRFRAYMACARKGIGAKSYFLGSWGVLSEAVGTIDACRISMDANPTWAGMRMQLVESARWIHTQRILFTNDPDHICVRAKLAWARSVASVVSLTGGLFMLSDPLAAYDADRLAMLRKCLPPLASQAGETGPLDATYAAFTWTKLHGFAVPRENVVRAQDVQLDDALNMAGEYESMNDDHPLSTLWSMHLDCGGRNWHVAVRVATVPLKACAAPLENLGLDGAGRYHVFDFWAQKYLGCVTGSLECAALELGDCQVLAMVKAADHPQLIASSRHVSMDAVSVRSHQWSGGKLALRLDCVPGAAETYFFHLPEGFASPKLASQGASAEINITGEIAAVTVQAEKKGCTLTLSF
jgi:hypothetical protein